MDKITVVAFVLLAGIFALLLLYLVSRIHRRETESIQRYGRSSLTERNIEMSGIVERSGEHLVVFESSNSRKVLAVLNIRVLATEYSSIRKGVKDYKYAILGFNPSGTETCLLYNVYHVDEILDEIIKHIARYSKNTTFTIPEVWSSEYTGKTPSEEFWGSSDE